MGWPSFFLFINNIALIGWLLLLVGPRSPRMAAIILYFGVGLLCLTYAVMFAAQFRSIIAGDFLSIEGIRTLFQSDGGVVLGWNHYLAFDLFIGQWIAKDGDHKGFSRWVQAPVLLLTLFAGPIGLLIWLFIRERRARAAARA